ncbi:MAG: GTPase Era [Acidobacteriota bacterium]|nr:GTPase Era [Acidobacteriota bacterium]
MPFRSGFVSIIGRPNAGKSTLLNALLGQRLAIVTHKPQTTRTRIQGVLELPARKKAKGVSPQPAAQVVLVDTPGVHKPETQLDRRMMQEVHDALESRDAVLFLVDVTHRLPKSELPAPGSPAQPPKASGRMALSAAEDDFALSLVKRLDCPVILVLNKIDAIRKADLLPLIAHWSTLHTFAEVVPISARRKEGLDLLLDTIVRILPEGQRYFPADQLTDQPERFLVAEIIREKILLLTGEEVPYATAVVIEKFEEPPEQPPARPTRKPAKTAANAPPRPAPKLPLTRIAAAIFCERTGQKAILIGKGGEMLKSIGTSARKDIESLLGTRVFLELFVKVQEDWRSSRGFVEELDWRRQLAGIAAKQSAEE